MWWSRPPGDGWLMLVGGHLVIVTKDASLHVVRANPEGYQEVASLQLFDDPSWTVRAAESGRELGLSRECARHYGSASASVTNAIF